MIWRLCQSLDSCLERDFDDHGVIDNTYCRKYVLSMMELTRFLGGDLPPSLGPDEVNLFVGRPFPVYRVITLLCSRIMHAGIAYETAYRYVATEPWVILPNFFPPTLKMWPRMEFLARLAHARARPRVMSRSAAPTSFRRSSRCLLVHSIEESLESCLNTALKKAQCLR